MPNFVVDIDSSEVREFTKKLREMHRSNFPITVRQTLNNLAMDVKQKTLIESADKEFILRNPLFFKSHTGVEFAKGWDVSTMQSEIGIIAKGSNVAMELRKQEYGGVSKKPMIYLNSSRLGNNKAKLVKIKNYVNEKGILKGGPNKSRDKEPQFVANAAIAFKTGKLIFAKSRSGTTIIEVNSIKYGKNKRGKMLIKGRYFSWATRKVKIKMTPLADYEKNREIKIKTHPFLRPASEKSFLKVNYFFIANAEKRFIKGRYK